MSRSYKKNAWVCDRNPFMKNYANRRVRRKQINLNGEEETGNYGWYRKVTCPWDICDWKWQLESSFEQYVQEHERTYRHWGFTPKSRKELLREWYDAIGK